MSLYVNGAIVLKVFKQSGTRDTYPPLSKHLTVDESQTQTNGMTDPKPHGSELG